MCVLVARPRRCPTLSNRIPWQNWMPAYLVYTLRMKVLFRGWPIMVHDTHTRRFHQVQYKSALDCMRNANKCPRIPYSVIVEKMKKWSGIQMRIRITTKVLEGHPYQVWSTSVSAFISYPVYRMTHRTTEWSHNLCQQGIGNNNQQCPTTGMLQRTVELFCIR